MKVKRFVAKPIMGVELEVLSIDFIKETVILNCGYHDVVGNPLFDDVNWVETPTIELSFKELKYLKPKEATLITTKS